MPQEVKRVLVPGVKFELYNESENPVLSPETGKLVSPGDRVCTITVDANGWPPPRTRTPTSTAGASRPTGRARSRTEPTACTR